MEDVVRRWSETAALFSDRLKDVGAHHWDLRTPCSEWNVRQLVEHAVGTQARFASLLGIGIEQAGADWAVVRSAMATRLTEPDALAATVDVPGLGPLSAEQIVEICANDLLIHTWDLARAIGADEALPADSVSACLAWLRGLPEPVLRSGRYAEAQLIDATADVQTLMLAFAGRQP